MESESVGLQGKQRSISIVKEADVPTVPGEPVLNEEPQAKILSLNTEIDVMTSFCKLDESSSAYCHISKKSWCLPSE
jgi:hypothetical protein